MDYFNDEEIENIKKMSKKYFSQEKFRRILVIRSKYIITDSIQKVFHRESISIPGKYDEIIHEEVVTVLTNHLNTREGVDFFHKIFLVNMREYDFAVVLFLKKEILDISHEVFSIGIKLLQCFIELNNEEFEESEKTNGRETLLVSGIQPDYFILQD